MTERELLRAIGEIEEKYIEEAAPVSAGKVVDLTKKRSSRRRVFGAAAAAAAAVFLIGIFPKMQRDMLTANQGAPAAYTAAAEAAAPAAGAAEMMEEAAAPAAATAAPEAFREAADPAVGAAPAAQAPETTAAETFAAAIPEPQALTTAAAQAFSGKKSMMEADMAADAEERENGMAAAWGNPFISCETMEEAEEIAGFRMEYPEETPLAEKYPVRDITAIENDMIQVICFDDAGNEGFRVRKAAGEEDISGVYGTYEEKTLENDGRILQLRLEDGKVRTVCWTEEGYSYAVMTDEAELDEQAAAELAGAIR
ncbi:MAG: hypothetical protein IJT43_02995 [Stomatobaculum sp.]|nr:hypothetical protein [Stomatobaculum sp.]